MDIFTYWFEFFLPLIASFNVIKKFSLQYKQNIDYYFSQVWILTLPFIFALRTVALALILAFEPVFTMESAKEDWLEG